jgi:hypothetical protein
MTLRLDRLQAANFNSRGMQTLWQRHCEALETNATDVQDQIDAINNLNSDNVLTPGKKPVWIFMYSFLTGEQSALDSEATTFGITTEKTAYDTAVSALTTYLATLTTPVAWNNLTGNTTIVGTTFRTKFNDVLVDKQALLNKMHDASLALANTAQTTANTATTNAATAQTAADTVKRDDAISTSWTSPGTVLSAADAGSDATITIAAHTRKYSDATSVSVNSGSLTARAYSTTYYIYYTQTSRAGGAVTYNSTTDPNVAQPNAAAGRHFVGKIVTPAAAAAPTSGGYTPPGGYSGSGEIP